MWHADAPQPAFRGPREDAAVGTVKESISAGKQGLQLLSSASDSLNLAGRDTSDFPHFGQPLKYLAGLMLPPLTPPTHIHYPHPWEEPDTPLSLWFLIQCPSWFPLMEA